MPGRSDNVFAAMDILKVLSRGTKQTPRTAAASAVTLPSAGARIQPQLFHDPVGATAHSSRKRKRAAAETGGDGAESSEEEEGEEDEEEDGLGELDFFGDRTAATATAAPDPAHKDKKATSGRDDARAQEAAADRKAALLDEDACRQILRSHRLKLALLGGGAEETDAKDKKDKKDKKSKKAKKEAKSKRPPALVPQPLTSFAQLRTVYRLSPRLADNLERLLYRVPTEVQMGSLPLLLDPAVALAKAGEATTAAAAVDQVDLLAVAPTGSGKTLSFLVPAIDGILRRRADERRRAAGAPSSSRPPPPRVLDTVVVAPTRELARQIAAEGTKLAAGTGVRVVAMRKGMRVAAEDGSERREASDGESDSDGDGDGDSDGDSDESDGEKKTAKGAPPAVTRADILVTTPLLLLHALDGGRTLPTVRSLVLDEADVLLDPLFRDQTLGLWAACTHDRLRATFWSATMASSVEGRIVDTLAARRRRQRSTTAAIQKQQPLVRLVVGLKDTAVPNVAHRLVYTATEQGKLLAMRQLLHPATSTSVTAAGSGTTTGGGGGGGTDADGSSAAPVLRPPFLVFTQTAERATALRDELQYDIPAAAGGADRLGVLHAALADGARAAVVRRFRAGQVWVLITTDVLARGIDFAGVNGVVNYDVPGSAAAYVHRAGRTGRAGRAGGLAVTLYTKEDIPFVKSVANVIAASEKQGGGAAGGIQKWLLDALPAVSKDDKKRLKRRGVESRRSVREDKKAADADADGHNKGDQAKRAAAARITSKSAWERRREHNRREAIAHSKQRKQESAGEAEWGGLD